MDTFHFKSIYYLNLDEDISTHKDFYQDIVNLSLMNTNGDINCEYKYCESKSSFNKFIDDFSGSSEIKNSPPILHITCHGGPKGIRLPSGGRIYWNTLARKLQKLNIACKNNLFVVFACCEGGHFILPIIEHLTNNSEWNRAPLFGIVTTRKEISLSEIINGFGEFYKELFNGFINKKADIDSAVQKLESIIQDNVISDTCSNIFRGFMERLLTSQLNNIRTDIRLDSKVSDMAFKKFRETGIFPSHSDLNSLRNNLKSQKFYLDFVNNKAKIYFMIDLYPENIKRFPNAGSINNWEEIFRS